MIKKHLLFVILSYNGYDDTAECIKSLLNCCERNYDILVVDNNSDPNTVRNLKKHFPTVELLELHENLGWAGGNNAGIHLALLRGYEWICLTNNDVVFPDNTANALSKVLQSVPPCLVHPSIFYWDDPDVAQLHPDNFVSISIDKEKIDRLWAGFPIMDYAYGACLAIHKSIFSSVGFLDERFFLQLEETDFYHRAANKNYTSICIPSIKIFHKESRSFGARRTPIKTYYIIRNTLLISEKNDHNIELKLQRLKRLYWIIRGISSANDSTTTTKNSIGFIIWLLLSRNQYARAIRFGFSDYITRRFGRISERKIATLIPK